MKRKIGERGFTLVELIVGISIAVFVTGAASMTIITMMRLSPRTNDLAVSLRQVQDAGYWITQDVQMSQGEIIVGDKNPVFLTLNEPQTPTENITVVYQFQAMPDNVRRLIRDNQTLGQQLLVAEYISPATTVASYNSDNSTLIFTITAVSGDMPVNRQYKAAQRIPQ